MKYFILSTFLLISLCTFSQSTLKGEIKNELNEPIAGATIYLQEVQKGTTTNFDGFYSLKDIPEGSYTVTVRMLGYQTKKEKVGFTSR